jgi:hypothetical protein
MGVITLTLISSHAQYTHPVSIIVLSCLGGAALRGGGVG